ncbi:MAG: hypothetical protein LBE24_02305 [Methylobacillus sp.]|nr:hypothetical protein [Methylobacillus sp.]
MRNALLLLIFVAPLLSGCGQDDQPPNPYQSQINDMNKARALEGQLQQEAEKKLQEADEQSK